MLQLAEVSNIRFHIQNFKNKKKHSSKTKLFSISRRANVQIVKVVGVLILNFKTPSFQFKWTFLSQEMTTQNRLNKIKLKYRRRKICRAFFYDEICLYKHTSLSCSLSQYTYWNSDLNHNKVLTSNLYISKSWPNYFIFFVKQLSPWQSFEKEE